MSGDSKIGPVGGIVRTTPLRSVASETAASARAAAPQTTVADSLPASQLIRLASGLAGQVPPVDIGRVASLRTAIANGSYGVHPAIIASAMVDFHTGGGE